jgi:hypothetical protein
MPWQRKYNFQAGNKIASGQVNGELDQLIDAVNTLETADADIELKAQMTKITTDTGDVNIKVNITTGDILQSIANAGVGFNTFYGVSGCVNNPSTGSIRGFSHINTTGNGIVYAQDTNGVIYTNSLVSGVWSGWNLQTRLWAGVYYPSDLQTVTPSKKLSQCKNGWMLVWSDYDVSVGSNDFDWVFTYIPKFTPSAMNGGSSLVGVANNLSGTNTNVTVKRLYISDSSITGHADNSVDATSTNDVCLRYVYEV